ncbi:MAG: hypothetical protein DRI26_01075 [Chloroflexi bacterium]|nr:MAG: hypothetical protein DRI26_01075 [Chloroflexota bacterium]
MSALLSGLIDNIRRLCHKHLPKLDSIDTKLTTNTEAIGKQTAYFYDYAVRRVGGRLLGNIDFTINKENFPVTEFDLKYCLVMGDYETYEIVKWEEIGLPKPPFTGSPYVLRVRVKANSTAYVLFPLPSEPAVPYASYITAYAQDYEVNVNQYIAINTDPENIRNNWLRDWKQLPNTWARCCNNWALEINWALTSHCYKITNPNPNPVDVYIAGCLASQLSFLLKGWSILYGYIDGYEFEVNNETLTQTLRLFLPQSIGEVYLMQTDGKIRGDGTNPFTVKHYLNGKLLVERSQTGTTDVWWFKQFKVSNIYTRASRFESLLVKVVMDTLGVGVISRFTYILFGSALEPEIPDYLEGTVSADTTETLYDYTNNCDGHIREIHELELVTDANVTQAYAEVHDAKTGWKRITPILGANETYTIKNFKMRSVGLRIVSQGGSTSYKCRTVLTDAFLIWE